MRKALSRCKTLAFTYNRNNLPTTTTPKSPTHHVIRDRDGLQTFQINHTLCHITSPTASGDLIRRQISRLRVGRYAKLIPIINIITSALVPIRVLIRQFNNQYSPCRCTLLLLCGVVNEI